MPSKMDSKKYKIRFLIKQHFKIREWGDLKSPLARSKLSNVKISHSAIMWLFIKIKIIKHYFLSDIWWFLVMAFLKLSPSKWLFQSIDGNYWIRDANKFDMVCHTFLIILVNILPIRNSKTGVFAHIASKYMQMILLFQVWSEQTSLSI